MLLDTPRGARPTPSSSQLEELHLLLNGYPVSQAISVVARLGVADLLADGPQACEELAQATGTHAPSLYRVLRLLAGVGLFDEVDLCRFALTLLGAGLRKDVPGSRRPWALMLLDDAEWQAYGDLLHTVQTGETAFDHANGMGRFEYLRRHPEAAAIFQEAMAANVEPAAPSLADVYDICRFERVVDIGGGHGAVLAAVLRACAGTRGVLFDRPEVVAGAAPLLERAGVAARCEIAGGDFFTAVPADADAYILRLVLHNWGDSQAVHVLRNCRVAIRESGRLLVIERAIAANRRDAISVLHTDLRMQVNQDGLERTDAEYRALFADADFRLANIVPLGGRSHFSVFEGMPA